MKTDRTRTLSDREMARIVGGTTPGALEVRWDRTFTGEPRHGPFDEKVRDPRVRFLALE